MDYQYKNKANFSSILIFALFVLTSSCACEFVTIESRTSNKPQIKKNPAPLFLVNGESDTNSASGLQSIYFDYKKSKTNELQSRFLDQNAQILTTNPDISIVLEVYCDPIGGRKYNYTLAADRGHYIKNYLVSKGIKSERILINPIGSRAKIAETKKADMLNERRVNFIIHSIIPLDVINPNNISIAVDTKSIPGHVTQIQESNTVTPLRASAKLLLNGESDLLTAGDLQSVFFEYKKYKIEKAQKDVLNKNIQFLKANPKISLALEVYCDPIGGDVYNSKLENKRLNYTINYLRINGINSSRISKKMIGPKPASNSLNNLQINNSKKFYIKERRINFVITNLP